MSNLIAGYSASSSFSSFANATSFSSPAKNIASTSTTLAQQSSFSFDAVFAQSSSRPIVSLPFGEGDKSSSSMMDMLSEKLAGFMAPFGEKGEKMAEIISSAMESLASLVKDTSVDAAAMSIDIRFARVEQSYSNGGGSSAGVFSGFALEVSVSTATVDFDPNRATVVNMQGSKVELSQSQMVEGHKTGVFRKSSKEGQQFPGYNPEMAKESREILAFLKETRKQIAAFSNREETSFRYQMKQALMGYNQYNVRT
jgi:hypothetical protein